MKIIFSIILSIIMLAIFPNLAAAECFLFQDNNFYCTDLPQQQAQEECSIYPDCDPLIHLSSSPCQSISNCQTDDTISLPVIVKQNSAQELPVIKNPAGQQEPAEPQFTILWLWLSAVVFIVAVYYAFSRNLIPGLKRQKRSKTIEEEPELPSAFWLPATNSPTEKKMQVWSKRERVGGFMWRAKVLQKLFYFLRSHFTYAFVRSIFITPESRDIIFNRSQ